VSGFSISWPYANLYLAPDRWPCQHPTTHFYRPDALPAAKPTVSKHWRQQITYGLMTTDHKDSESNRDNVIPLYIEHHISETLICYCKYDTLSTDSICFMSPHNSAGESIILALCECGWLDFCFTIALCSHRVCCVNIVSSVNSE